MNLFLAAVLFLIAGLLLVFGPRLFRAPTPYAWARIAQKLPPIIFAALMVFVAIRLLVA